MLTATVTVNLDHKRDNDMTFDHDHADRRALQHLAQLPDRAHLRVVVGARAFLSCSAVAWLAQHEERLDVEIDATDGWVVRRWYDAIKSGEVM